MLGIASLDVGLRKIRPILYPDYWYVTEMINNFMTTLT